MGIPGFASRMQAHGSYAVIGRANKACHGQAIIDGPSLAHALPRVTEQGENDQRVGPGYNYSALGEAAVAWLDNLQAFGFTIEGIYFDGALPEYKKKTRVDRLQGYVDNLVAYKARSTELEQASRKRKKAANIERLQRVVESWRAKLLPPPFLVFAVVEALLKSGYADLTYMVPGEADEFCAAAALDAARSSDNQTKRIFTNDSDLLLYVSSEATRVVQIDELSEGEDAGVRTLHSLEHWPSQLTRIRPYDQQPLQEITQPAYLMQQDRHLSFRGALAKAHENPSIFATEEFEDFAATYDLIPTRASLISLKQQRQSGMEISQPLDSRVSELLHAARQISQRPGQSKEAGRSDPTNERNEANEDGAQKPQKTQKKVRFLEPAELELYLPVLFEDPSRATAWKMGRKIRHVALHLTKTGCEGPVNLSEYARSGHSIRQAVLEEISEDTIDTGLEEWILLWKAELQRPGPDRWRLLVLQHLLADMNNEGVSLPSKEDVIDILDGRTAVSWEIAHLSAQFQAEYYSLRILKQVLESITQRAWPGEIMDAGGLTIKAAQEVLQDLPGIEEFFDVETRNDAAGKRLEAAILTMLRKYEE